MTRTTPTRRERYRAETRDEAKGHALEQLAESGSAGLSLNAIARAMGMTGPALYRYFGSRDELITELIIDAYNDLSVALEQAVEHTTAAEAGIRAMATAFREWTLAQPHRYQLIFGTPLPGYAAPEQTTIAARRAMKVVLTLIADTAAGRSRPDGRLDAQLESGPWVPDDLRDRLTGPQLAYALLLTARLHGLVSLEISGQYTLMEFDPALLFDREVDTLVAELTLG
jgi:AcrR family transcriptional regulator